MSSFKSSAIVVSNKTTSVTPTISGDLSIVARNDHLQVFNGLVEQQLPYYSDIVATSGDLQTLVNNEAIARANADSLLTPLTTTASISGGLNGRLVTVEGNYATKATPIAGTYNNVIVNSQGIVTSGGNVTYSATIDLSGYTLLSTTQGVSATLNTSINNANIFRAAGDLALQTEVNNITGGNFVLDTRYSKTTDITTISGGLNTSINNETIFRVAGDLALQTEVNNITGGNFVLDTRYSKTSDIAVISGGLNTTISNEALARSNADALLTPLTTTADISGGLNGRLVTVESNYATKATPVAGTYNNVVVNSQGIVTSGGIINYVVPNALTSYTLMSTTQGVSATLNTSINNETMFRVAGDSSLQTEINNITGSSFVLDTRYSKTSDIAIISGGIQNQINLCVPYTGATTNVDLGTHKITTDAVQFNLNSVTSVAPGQISWNISDRTFDMGLDNDVTLQVGQEEVTLVYNGTGSTIINGQPCYISGILNENPIVHLASAALSGNASVVSGVATEPISAGGLGFITVKGKVRGLNTSSFTTGQQIYLGETPGTFTAQISGFAYSSHTNPIGYVGTVDAVTGSVFISIENESTILMLSEKETNVVLGSNISTGVYEYTGMTVTTSASFTIPPLKGLIIENTGTRATNPYLTDVIYSGGTFPVTNILTDIATYVLIDRNNNITQQVTYPTPQQRRDNIFLGKIVHTNKSNILTINNTVDYTISPMSSLRDMFTPISIINEGVVIYPDGANLSFYKTAGSLYGMGINWANDQKSPNRVTFTGSTPVNFGYYSQTSSINPSTTLLDPSHYDNGGVITAIPSSGDGGGNRSTNVRVYLFTTGNVIVQYGQQIYSSLSLAVAGTQSENFVKFPAIPGGAVLIGIISVRRTATVLNDVAYAKFTPASIFGEATGGTAGISTTTLQQAYENSSTPEIVTNSILDGVTFRRGSTSDSDGVIQIQNGVGQNVITFTGLGEITSASISGNANNLIAHDINGKLIDVGAKISDYTLLSTTTSLTGSLNTLITNETIYRAAYDFALQSEINNITGGSFVLDSRYSKTSDIVTISGGLNNRLTTVESNYATKASPISGTYNNVVFNSQGIVTSGGNISYALSSSLSSYTLLSTTAGISGSLQGQINAIVQEGTTIASSGGTILINKNVLAFNLEVSDYISKTDVKTISGGLNTSITNESLARYNADLSLQSEINNITGGSFLLDTRYSKTSDIVTISGGLNNRLTTVESNYATKATPTAGTYNNVTVSSQGIVTSGGNINYGVLSSAVLGVNNDVVIFDAAGNLKDSGTLLSSLATTSSLGNYLPIAGGTVTGSVTFNNTTSTVAVSGTLRLSNSTIMETYTDTWLLRMFGMSPNGANTLFEVKTSPSTGINSGKAFAVFQYPEGTARGMFYSDGKYGLGGGGTRDIYIFRDSANTLGVGNLNATNSPIAGNGNLKVYGNVTISGGSVYVSNFAGVTSTLLAHDTNGMVTDSGIDPSTLAIKSTPIAGTYNNVVVNSSGIVTSGGNTLYDTWKTLSTVPTPTTPGVQGATGYISGYLYHWVANNTVVRAAVATSW